MSCAEPHLSEPGALPSRDRSFYPLPSSQPINPYLRSFMRFVDRHLGEIERGRGRVAVKAIMADWPTDRGKAIEHLVREGIDQLLPDERTPI